jgi:hypothetical protein
MAAPIASGPTQAFREQAEHHVQSTLQQISDLVAAHPNLNLEAAAAASTSSSSAKVSFGGLLFTVVTGEFSFADGTSLNFSGKGGGLSIGGGVSWGTLSLNVPPAQLKGMGVNFQYSILTALVTVNFWSYDTGAYLGGFIGGGVNIGGGTGGGYGSF